MRTLDDLEIEGIRVDLYSPSAIEGFLRDCEQVAVAGTATSFFRGDRSTTHLADSWLNRLMRQKLDLMPGPNYVLDLPNADVLGEYLRDRRELDPMAFLLKYRQYVVYPPGIREALEELASQPQDSSHPPNQD